MPQTDCSSMFPLPPADRRKEARDIREKAIALSEAKPLPAYLCNGEEGEYTQSHGFPLANFSKGLPHNEQGEVDANAYAKLLAALHSGRHADFEQIPLGTLQGRKLTNPQAGLAFDLEGHDPQAVVMPPVPRFDSRRTAAEIIELYWMALVRDVNFTDFESNPGVAASASELAAYQSELQSPGAITPKTVFRGITRGDQVGPFISQFFFRDIPYGSLTIKQRQTTVMPGRDYLTDYNAWLAVQNGVNPGGPELDPTPRYIRNMRDIAQYVHVDALYEAYLNAALILLNMNQLLDDGIPYKGSRTQDGFATFGGPHLLTLVTEVATRALKAVWFNKWYVHRRMRPEEFGGRVQLHRTGARHYPLHPDILNSKAHESVLRRFKSSLLPVAFPEGSPVHPAYGSGHATVGGACVTVLKAWFNGGLPLPGPIVVPNADGTLLVDYTGSDRSQITVGGELDKLVSNIAIARNMAGVHWRTDYIEAIRLGEQIGLELLAEQSITFNEPNVFTVQRFDGSVVKIRDGKVIPEGAAPQAAVRAA